MLRQSLAFCAPFVGDAHLEFRDYLYRCRDAYAATPREYPPPCVKLLQSSGFGKSRLLFELAKTMCAGSTNQRGGGGMRILYVSARNYNRVRHLTGFPEATVSLKFWIFNGNVSNQLVTAFEYAETHWGDIGELWLRLFDTSSADSQVVDAFKAPRRQTDAAVLEGKDTASDGDAGSSDSTSTVDRAKFVVIVMDEARSLSDAERESFRTGLHLAQGRIGSSRGHIFGVLVDTHSQEFPITRDAAAGTLSWEGKPFPPFVRTHTTDVLLGPPRSFDYKASVMEANPATMWNTPLERAARSGRPVSKTFTTVFSSYMHRNSARRSSFSTRPPATSTISRRTRSAVLQR